MIPLVGHRWAEAQKVRSLLDSVVEVVGLVLAGRAPGVERPAALRDCAPTMPMSLAAFRPTGEPKEDERRRDAAGTALIGAEASLALLFDQARQVRTDPVVAVADWISAVNALQNACERWTRLRTDAEFAAWAADVATGAGVIDNLGNRVCKEVPEYVPAVYPVNDPSYFPGTAGTPTRRRGRPKKPDGPEKALCLRLYRNWKAQEKNGITKAEFARRANERDPKGHRYTQEQIGRFLERGRKAAAAATTKPSSG